MVLLYQQLGPASLVALASLMIMLPIQAVVVKRTAVFVKKATFSTDERAKLEGELLSGKEDGTLVTSTKRCYICKDITYSLTLKE